jgi:glyoxylase-like metal-dependent hydrolase (beta-lactamase superfamily II)
VGNAAFITNNFGCQVVVHELEADMLASGFTPLPKGTNFFTRISIGLAHSGIIPKITTQPCEPDIRYASMNNEPEFIPGLKIIHTPGHTQGSVSLIVDNHIVICGDTLFGVFPGSIFPPFADDVPTLLRSWQVLLNTGGETFLPSHGREISRKLLNRKVSGI